MLRVREGYSYRGRRDFLAVDPEPQGVLEQVRDSFAPRLPSSSTSSHSSLRPLRDLDKGLFKRDGARQCTLGRRGGFPTSHLADHDRR